MSLIITSFEVGTRYHKTTPAPTLATKVVAPAPAQLDEYRGQLTIIGPLANWIRDAENGKIEDAQPMPPGPPYSASVLDRVLRRPTPAPHNFVHSTFNVKTYTAFEILVPPGTISASLSGSFQAFTYAAGQRQPADVQVLLLDNDGLHDFVHGGAGSAVYSIEPCSQQSLKWLLNSDYRKVSKYYFVFHNPDTRTQLPSVKANFTVQFN